jgi:hypothetical protein
MVGLLWQAAVPNSTRNVAIAALASILVTSDSLDLRVTTISKAAHFKAKARVLGLAAATTCLNVRTPCCPMHCVLVPGPDV